MTLSGPAYLMFGLEAKSTSGNSVVAAFAYLRDLLERNRDAETRFDSDCVRQFAGLELCHGVMECDERQR